MDMWRRYFVCVSNCFCVLLLLLLIGCSGGDSTNDFVEIIDWGPQEAAAGKAFNAQPDGSSAIWFRHAGIRDAKEVDVWVGDVNLGNPAIAKDIGSFIVPARLTQHARLIPVFLIVKSTNLRVDLGVFEVK